MVLSLKKRRCTACGTTNSKLQYCKRCILARYCSKTLHWKAEHKAKCVESSPDSKDFKSFVSSADVVFLAAVEVAVSAMPDDECFGRIMMRKIIDTYAFEFQELEYVSLKTLAEVKPIFMQQLQNLPKGSKLVIFSTGGPIMTFFTKPPFLGPKSTYDDAVKSLRDMFTPVFMMAI